MIDPEVKCLQEVLKSQGASICPYAATGYYGPGTRLSIKKFQEKYASEILTPQGLKQGNGIFDSYTRNKLNALLK